MPDDGVQEKAVVAGYGDEGGAAGAEDVGVGAGGGLARRLLRQEGQQPLLLLRVEHGGIRAVAPAPAPPDRRLVFLKGQIIRPSVADPGSEIGFFPDPGFQPNIF